MMKKYFVVSVILTGILGLVIFQACSSGSSGVLVPTHAQQSTGWSIFTKQNQAVFEPQNRVAGDASVISFGGKYLMYYSCLDSATNRLTICVATSTDGLSWAKPDTGVPLLGRVLKSDPSWATAEETSYALNVNGVIYLYFSGYAWTANVGLNYPSYLGLAASVDGLNFYYPSNSPILAPTLNGLDNDAIYSPSVIKSGSTYNMIYSAYCFTSTKCKTTQPVSILGATSTDAIAFTKQAQPVLEANPNISWMSKSVAEPDLVQGPDGRYYLFLPASIKMTFRKLGSRIRRTLSARGRSILILSSCPVHPEVSMRVELSPPT